MAQSEELSQTLDTKQIMTNNVKNILKGHKKPWKKKQVQNAAIGPSPHNSPFPARSPCNRDGNVQRCMGKIVKNTAANIAAQSTVHRSVAALSPRNSEEGHRKVMT